MPPELYPAFLKLEGLRVVVVGGGVVAASKLGGLLAAGARVTVVAPTIGEEIRGAGVELVERGFVDGDLDGARWVVAAATPEVNRAVAAAAEARGLFVNAVDDVASASAYLGGVVRRGSILVAISTNGLAPALAGLLREALEAVLPEQLERWVEVAREARADWKRAGVPMAERRPLLLRALERIYRPAARVADARPLAVAASVGAAFVDAGPLAVAAPVGAARGADAGPLAVAAPVGAALVDAGPVAVAALFGAALVDAGPVAVAAPFGAARGADAGPLAVAAPFGAARGADAGPLAVAAPFGAALVDAAPVAGASRASADSPVAGAS